MVHLASNPDIAAAATDPEIDFREGTVLTNNVVEECEEHLALGFYTPAEVEFMVI